MARQIFITEADMHRLEQLVETRLPGFDAALETLENQLSRAVVVPSDRIPKNVVTMNSRVRIQDSDNGAESMVAIVFPFESNAEHNRVSVLAPLGTALLGARVGGTVAFNAPGGRRRVKIIAIEYQPEAAGRERLPAANPVDVTRISA